MYCILYACVCVYNKCAWYISVCVYALCMCMMMLCVFTLPHTCNNSTLMLEYDLLFTIYRSAP
ncbi:hypothetical protein EON63_07855 [archaeon]|nr:MAG: hypothetical protein EON63_07855 [archaeon]